MKKNKVTAGGGEQEVGSQNEKFGKKNTVSNRRIGLLQRGNENWGQKGRSHI